MGQNGIIYPQRCLVIGHADVYVSARNAARSEKYVAWHITSDLLVSSGRIGINIQWHVFRGDLEMKLSQMAFV